MKSLHNKGVAGNSKLNGKKEKVLKCRCCVVQNFKWSERVKEAKKEIQKN